MWRVNEAVAQVSVDSGAWALPADTGTILRLSGSAVTIWKACDGLDVAQEVVARLVECEGWEPEVIRAYVEDMIETLKASKLLLEVPS